jgi:hypothetical protein
MVWSGLYLCPSEEILGPHYRLPITDKVARSARSSFDENSSSLAFISTLLPRGHEFEPDKEHSSPLKPDPVLNIVL